MGRTIIAEERVQGDLGRLSGSHGIQIGLLVGQVTAQKDYVAFFIRTPSLSDICKNEGDSTPADLFENWWVVEHSRQVTMMLPGGLSVVGVFLVGPPDLLKTMQPQLRQLLADICHDSGLPPPPHRTRSLLHVCTRTKKHKCQTLDLADSQAVFRPAELKYLPHSSKWHRLECSLALHINTHISCNQKSKSFSSDLQQSIQAGLQPTLDSIGRALVLVHGQHPQPEEPLVRPSGQKKASAVKGEIVPAALLLRRPHPPCSSAPKLLDHCTHLQITGNMYCYAFVHSRATCGEAIAAIKQDAARSFLSRVDALCKSLEAEKAEKTDEDNGSGPPDIAPSIAPTSWQLPRRVAVRLPSSNLCISDYCFPEENEEEFKSNTAELLSVNPGDITVEYLEEFLAVPSPEECLVETVGAAEVVGKASTENASLPLLSLVGLVAAAVVALVAVVAWLVQYLIK